MDPKEILPETPGGVYDVPDRLTGRESLGMLRRLHPGREWRFVEVDIDYQASLRISLFVQEWDSSLIRYWRHVGVTSASREDPGAHAPERYW